MSPIEKGCLYIVATPIGNLDDISHRGAAVLAGVNAIAAEDTRHSQKLLQHLGISTPLFAFHEHNESGKTGAVIRRLQEGEAIALISDAGTPLVSDPGFVLVKQAMEAGIRVIPVPGASSILAALSCSGLPTDRFVFEGFIPAKKGARKNHLETLKNEHRSQIFFEAPHRIAACLEDMKAVFGATRLAVLARELTKTHETFLHGTLEELHEKVLADSNQSRGEIVLLVAGADRSRELDSRAMEIMDALLKELSLKKASALAAEITGMGKNIFYEYGLGKQKK